LLRLTYCVAILYTRSMAETKTAQINLRMQPSLKRTLEKAAADDRRSLTGLIEKLVYDYLRKKGYLK
jgi:hypothetical protein